MTDLYIDKLLKNILMVGGRHSAPISLFIILLEARVNRLQILHFT